MNGIFTISLDFELHWGVFDKRNITDGLTRYKNTIALIPELLALFEASNVHATWAVVGSLIAQNKIQWAGLKPLIEPEYELKKYSAYNWVKENGLQHKVAHFAPSSVTNILNYPYQEVGTHTFSHYYCLEKQKNKNAFADDLKAVKKAGELINNRPISLVFPRNQFNFQYLDICYKAGIKTVRTNPVNWYWKYVSDEDTDTIRKIFRTGDAYISLSKTKTSYPLNTIEIKAQQPIQLPASRFLRPWQPKYSFLNKLRLKRILHELNNAALNNECYHLWWHPENFGDYPAENINDLKIILEHYKKCQNKYGMISWNMGEYANHFNIDN